jgi:hypothetical protein
MVGYFARWWPRYLLGGRKDARSTFYRIDYAEKEKWARFSIGAARTAGGRYLLAYSVEDVERWLDGPEECSPTTGDNMPKHDHHKAAAHHDEAAKSHRDAAEAHENGNQADASQHSQMANDHSAQAHEASQRAHDKTKGPKKL